MSASSMELVTTPATEVTVTDHDGNQFLVDRIRWAATSARRFWVCHTLCQGGEPTARRNRMFFAVVDADEPLSWPTGMQGPPEWFVTAAEALRAETASQDRGERLRRLLGEQIREATARLDGLTGRPRDAAQGFLDGLRLARTLLDTDGSVE